MKQPLVRRALAGVTALALGLSGAIIATQPAMAAAQLVAHYPLDESSGTVAVDASGAGRDGAYVGSPALSGGEGVRLDGADDHVKLPNNLLAGLASITVSAEVLVRAAQGTPYFIYGFGNTDAGGVGNGYLYSTGNAYKTSIASGNWSTEQTANSGANLERDVWKTITYTLDDATNTARVYLDGIQVAQNANVTITPGSIGGGVTTANYLGRSVYNADKRLAGSLRDVRIYDTALTAADVAALVPSDATRLERDAAALSLGDLSQVTADVTLPSQGANGALISWASSNTAVVSATGAVTRPAAGAPAAEVTLTATLTRGAASETRAFTATVLPLPGGAVLAQDDLDAIVIPNGDDIRGNITLPATGSVNGSGIDVVRRSGGHHHDGGVGRQGRGRRHPRGDRHHRHTHGDGARHDRDAQHRRDGRRGPGGPRHRLHRRLPLDALRHAGRLREDLLRAQRRRPAVVEAQRQRPDPREPRR